MKFTHCPAGGLGGWLINSSERVAIKKGKSGFATEMIKIPERASHPLNCVADHDNPNITVYWEDEKTGSHGWCCSICGEVLQWG